MKGHLVRRADLTPAQRDRMRAILDSHFHNITPETFERDLAAKNWVILITDDAARLVGFSTLLLYESNCESRRIAVVYSGDTIIERDAWGSAALPKTWIESVWQLHAAECPNLPLYWLLITSGFRTYRFLSVFWREFFPSCTRPTPQDMQRLLDHLARERFGPLYDPAAGVAHFTQPLRPELLDIPEAKLKDPHVAFFAAKNPHYTRGDELVCVAPLTPNNLTPAGRRMVLAGEMRSMVRS